MPLCGEEVAPHAGAWIETLLTAWQSLESGSSRPTRARGLKLDLVSAAKTAIKGRAPRGRVD